MTDLEEKLIERLKGEHIEFRQLMKEHQEYEEKLAEFDKLRYLTSEEEIERKRIQKLKLLCKDRMAQILKEYGAEKAREQA
ncbi:MAG: DUF465 domain-containing protein [Candidatus Tectomicrobia bacterium]|nr:DUF465 domain-containing protein [Candidatus Tectomicrobia bacterium]